MISQLLFTNALSSNRPIVLLYFIYLKLLSPSLVSTLGECHCKRYTRTQQIRHDAAE